MGYTLEFDGQFNLTPKLTEAQRKYLEKFASTRRVKRYPLLAAEMPDPERELVGLPIGDEGEYFVGGTGYMGQNEDASIIDRQVPPKSQPGLYCQWIPNDEGTAIEWDGNEKFNDYEEWLEYIIQHFFKPWGITANGTIQYQGEESADQGQIVVTNNKISFTS